MTTELILLLGLFVFILGGVFMGEKGPRKVFVRSAPRLAARVEKHINFGHRFSFGDGSRASWGKPSASPPLGAP